MSRYFLLTAGLAALATLATPHPASTKTQIYRLKNGDGAVPLDRLVPDGVGGFYGTPSTGNDHGKGDFGHGTVVNLTPPVAPQTRWSFTVLHKLSRPDGRYPLDLVLAMTDCYTEPRNAAASPRTARTARARSSAFRHRQWGKLTGALPF